ncbi:MAG TPA: A/G-specific adenine glycosylase [Acidisarcina sp.]|nr:A/G-specific adenine glycosylase [Acidisarcina sp.]
MSEEEWAPAKRKKFRARLLRWFGAHRRDLPWRRTEDPYKIWVSEIMLQQTRVAAVLEHYAEFLRRFPTVAALAEAPEADVLAVWSGLGYYRRARMLHRGAQVVVQQHGSLLPRTAAELALLPGIGAYTSAAIASIAFGESVAAVDGNVERVITRIAGLAEGSAAADRALRSRISRQAIHRLADELVDPAHPGDFNQAMMELGATLCLPRKPLCAQCPVVELCQTRGEHPVEPRRPTVRHEIAYALVVAASPSQSASKGTSQDTLRGTRVLLHQRPLQGTVMPGMWELPEIDSHALDAKSAELIVRHAIMQTTYIVHVHAMGADGLARHRKNERAEQWVLPEALSLLPLTGLARKVLRRVGLMTTLHAQS